MNNNINKAKSGLIYIDSRRRDYGTTSAFTISWNQDIALDAIGLLSVIIPRLTISMISTISYQWPKDETQ